MNEEEMLVPLWDHVAEMRRTFLYSLATILATTCVLLFFYENVFSWLTRPLHRDPLQHQEIRRERIYNTSTESIHYQEYTIPAGEFVDIERPVDINKLVVLGPIEGMLVTFKVCFWLGLVLSAPIWVFFVVKFIYPGLRSQEKRLIAPFLTLSLFFMGTGALLAYFVTIPLANQYLLAFNASIGLNFWSLSQYLDYTLFLVLANALAFELGVILLFLVHYGFLTPETMAAKRRHMIVLAFVLGALLTPPDILTQFMLAIPLIGLYELILIYARLPRVRGRG